MVVKDLRNTIVIISAEAFDWFYNPSMMLKKKKGYKLSLSYKTRALSGGKDIGNCQRILIA